jgi:hypothetical protein
MDIVAMKAIRGRRDPKVVREFLSKKPGYLIQQWLADQDDELLRDLFYVFGNADSDDRKWFAENFNPSLITKFEPIVGRDFVNIINVYTAASDQKKAYDTVKAVLDEHISYDEWHDWLQNDAAVNKLLGLAEKFGPVFSGIQPERIASMYLDGRNGKDLNLRVLQNLKKILGSSPAVLSALFTYGWDEDQQMTSEWRKVILDFLQTMSPSEIKQAIATTESWIDRIDSDKLWLLNMNTDIVKALLAVDTPTIFRQLELQFQKRQNNRSEYDYDKLDSAELERLMTMLGGHDF